MTDQPDPARQALVPTPDAALPATDAHGFDPADYDWVPVRRQRRADGWTRDKQRAFVAELAQSGSVAGAARAIGMSRASADALRHGPGGAGFDAAWDAALGQAMHRLLDGVVERAIHGTEEAVYDREGRVIGQRRRYSDRLAMFLLRAHMPDRFRLAHRADRDADEPLPQPAVPVEQAARLLDPVTPPEPHRLMAPDDLATALTVADILPGCLPRHLRDPDLEPASAADPALDDAPLGEAFERDLAAAKTGTWRAPPPKRA